MALTIMQSDPWNPAQYDRFREERSQPFHDLMALVHPEPEMRVLDLGCGTGRLTRILHTEMRARETLGIDRSASMLETARHEATDGLSFLQADIATFTTTEPWDLVFSNAALHWLPDQHRLIAHLATLVRNGGQLAIQVPANFDMPTHTVARDLAREPEFRDQLAQRRDAPGVLAIDEYAALLYRLRFLAPHVRMQVYPHVLANREEVIEWVKGTHLNSYREGLGDEAFTRFLAQYRERLFALLPDERPFFFPFKRILMHARKGLA